MKITFPYIGPVKAYKKLLEILGHEVVMASRPSTASISLGIKHSPEFICFPFKVILGSYLEAIARGADTVVTAGGVGACRAGYFGDLSRRILKQMGYDVKFYIFNSIFDDFPAFYGQIRELTRGISIKKVLSTMWFVLRMVYISDSYEKKINALRPYEVNYGDCKKAWLQIQELFEHSNNMRELNNNMKIADELIAAIRTRPRNDVLKIGVVGEIYYVMESALNNDLEDRLGRDGVQVLRNKYISHWLNHNLWPPFLKNPHHRITEKANSYLRHGLGGHERENIGYILHFKESGCDGIIHLMPFGCMPELVTQTIIPHLSRDLDIPILSLSLDEQTGWVNVQARLEAFLDLLRNRKEHARYI